MEKRVLLALDIDGTLIDTRGSFDVVVKAVSGVVDDDAIAAFRATGGFNDDWELARALKAWAGAGRPKIVERCSTLSEVLAWCEHDPGDLSAACIARYRGDDGHPAAWKNEQPMVSAAALEALSDIVDVVACTGRDRWEFERAEELLGYSFAKATTMELEKKPEPRALLRLLDDNAYDLVALVGDTHADRLTIKNARRVRPDQRFAFVFVDYERRVAPMIQAINDGEDAASAVLRFSETEH
jgi:phosphoglycolate phosphatase-like HAD superfamily hydrolase